MSQNTSNGGTVLKSLPEFIKFTKAVFGESALEKSVSSKSERLRFMKALESVTGPNDPVSLDSAVALFKLLKVASARKQVEVLNAYQSGGPDVTLNVDMFLRLLYLLAASNPKTTPKDLAVLDSALTRTSSGVPLTASSFFKFVRSSIEKRPQKGQA